MDTLVSVVLFFACLFCAFYFMTVSYSLMIFWITTMLVLLNGLLGEFTIDVLLLRIEETALGAVIGVGGGHPGVADQHPNRHPHRRPRLHDRAIRID